MQLQTKFSADADADVEYELNIRCEWHILQDVSKQISISRKITNNIERKIEYK